MDLINILLIVVAGITLFFSSSIYFHNKHENQFTVVFALLVLNVTFWSASMVAFRYLSDFVWSFTALRVLYVSPIFIPIIFLYFTLVFTKTKLRADQQLLLKSSAVAMSLFIVYLTGFTDLIVSNTVIPEMGEKIIYFGNLYFIYIIHYLLFFNLAFFVLIKKYFKEQESIIKKQIINVLAGTSLSSAAGMTTNLILPWFGYFQYNWVGNFMTIFLVGFVLYAVVQYRLFNIKVIATELLTVGTWILLLIGIFLMDNLQERLFGIGLLILIVVLGIFTIRSVLEEVDHREEIEKLAKDLEKANERLKELDQLKSEFVSIASHQLRSPLTAIKGYTSLILEGSFGAVSESVREAVQKVFDSSNLMVKSVQDFLDVSRIEQGKMKYEYEIFDMKTIVKTVSDEQTVVATEKKLAFVLKMDDSQEYKVNGDIGKIKQVLTNIVDNSIKYTPEGSITMTLSKTDQGKVLVEVTDTGVGINSETLPKLFDKFVRAKGASQVNSKGTGLGLYVAKKMIEEQKGRVWATSDGEGKGSTFHIELNAV